MLINSIMTAHKSGDTAESRKWFTHFSLRSMTALHVSSFPALQLTESERRTITPSIQQFQLGKDRAAIACSSGGRNTAAQ